MSSLEPRALETTARSSRDVVPLPRRFPSTLLRLTLPNYLPLPSTSVSILACFRQLTTLSSELKQAKETPAALPPQLPAAVTAGQLPKLLQLSFQSPLVQVAETGCDQGTMLLLLVESLFLSRRLHRRRRLDHGKRILCKSCDVPWQAKHLFWTDEVTGSCCCSGIACFSGRPLPLLCTACGDICPSALDETSCMPSAFPMLQPSYPTTYIDPHVSS
jgi:hypothetical protein